MSHASRLALLKDRALLFQKVRSFFLERGILEVDTPLLSKTAPIDEHIDIFSVDLGDGKTGYLHSSPEYAMKRLLALGLGDIYQMSHVFRQGEIGSHHNPEFTLIEWYRLGISFDSFITETLALIHLFLGPLPSRSLSYRQALLHFAHLDYLNASQEDLLRKAHEGGIDLSNPSDWDKDALLNVLFSTFVEPHLGKEELLVLTDYPASQAALASLEEKDGETVAKRFEIYHRGLELCNGYLELTDPSTQRTRLLHSQEKRRQQGKPFLPVDELFLKALEEGLPPCCGVAVGFDRLLLLRHNVSSLDKVFPFAWQEI